MKIVYTNNIKTFKRFLKDISKEFEILMCQIIVDIIQVFY